MGKSTACLKIIACGNNDSVDRDDLGAHEETKGSSDQRGWSFRKRSSRHRVLSNAANSEIASKESPESHVVSFQAQPELAVQEKTSSAECNELEGKGNLPAEQDSNVSDTHKDDQFKEDLIINESKVIKIQAAIRGFLARSLLLKHCSNVIKLQAAVRGHIVRTNAVGTLRCLQAIIKMQALVRARLARRDNTGKDNLVPMKLDKKETKSSGGTYAYASLENLLNNAFARKLMETTPRTQPIRIKCEPLKSDSDSAWKWLERWMPVSTVSSEEPPCESSEPPITEHSEKETLNCSLISSGNNEEMSLTESEDDNGNDLTGHEANNVDVEASESMSPNPSEPQNSDESNTRHNEQESDVPIEIEGRDLRTGMEGEESLTEQKETEIEMIVSDLKSSSSSTEQNRAETKMFSRKASNPSFVAAQSKFEELSSAKAIASSSGNDYGANPCSDKANDDHSLSKDNVTAYDIPISNDPAVQNVASESGTEHSITSTLDSEVNGSDSLVNDLERERKILAETEANGSMKHSEAEVITGKETDPPQHAGSDESEKPENTDPAIKERVGILQGDENDLKLDAGSEISHVAYKSSSPNASPRSHITVPESQATPSSETSVNKRKKSGGEKTKSSGNKPKSSSSGDKKSPLNRNNHQDSASKNSSEKRQAKQQDQHDKEHEARVSSSISNNSLPSYMQATESARAKAVSNGSPRSSPDVHEKDLYLKKRHSLPGGNERQGSPRIHRSLSQAGQLSAKGNGTTQSSSPQDRKWRR